jgi:two-component system chemotaxis response regulator CheY
MRFLIIDDCAISRKLLSTFFAPYGSSECADNGGLGLDLFCKASRSPEPFDLVCLDISMPGMNGYETLDAIRKFEDARNTPPTAKAKVLIITAFADEECLLKTYDKCQGYIIKPIRVQKLSEKLAALGVKPGAATHPASATRVAEDHSELANVIPLIVLRDGNSRCSLGLRPGAPGDRRPGETGILQKRVCKASCGPVDLSAAKLPLGQGSISAPTIARSTPRTAAWSSSGTASFS